MNYTNKRSLISVIRLSFGEEERMEEYSKSWTNETGANRNF